MKIKFITFLSIICAIMVSCGNDNEPDGNRNNLKEGQIEMKIYPGYMNKVLFIVAVNTIKIDWGDGTVDDVKSNGIEQIFSHTYADNNLRTVLVNTTKLLHFYFDTFDYDPFGVSSLVELRIGNCPTLKTISVNNCQLTVLSINKADSLTSLNCSVNKIKELDISGCNALTTLYCANNQLTSLDVSGCSALTYLDCKYNHLTSLDVTDCSVLSSLICYNNRLTSLVTKDCVYLLSLHCYNNQLSSLNISGCRSLKELYFPYNNLLESELNTIFSDLPTVSSSSDNIIWCADNPGYYTCNKSIAKNKGWIFIE